jgi:hypothetical protein
MFHLERSQEEDIIDRYGSGSMVAARLIDLVSGRSMVR